MITNHIDQYNGVFIIVFKNPFNFSAFVYIFISLNLESDYIDTSYQNFEVNRFTKMVKIRTFKRFEKLHVSNVLGKRIKWRIRYVSCSY